jgi:hypothetical protein
MTIATYTILNNTGKIIWLLNSNGISVAVSSSAALSLDDVGYLNAVEVLGKANVIPTDSLTSASGSIISEVADVGGTLQTEVYFTVSVTTAAQTLAQLGITVPTWALFAYITPEATGIPVLRYRSDGVAPTASIGQPISSWQAWPIQGYNTLKSLQIISAIGSSVTTSIIIRG